MHCMSVKGITDIVFCCEIKLSLKRIVYLDVLVVVQLEIGKFDFQVVLGGFNLIVLNLTLLNLIPKNFDLFIRLLKHGIDLG